jgi:hypothetical protein
MLRSNTDRKLRLGIETLEDRRLLSGTVTISVDDGALTITGDRKGNCIEISTQNNEVRIEGCSRTRIRGDIGDEDIEDIHISLFEGKDEVRLHDLDFEGDVSIHTHEGKDNVEMEDVNIDGDLSIALGQDKDRLRAQNATAEDVSVDGKDQKDEFDDRGNNSFDEFECANFEEGC